MFKFFKKQKNFKKEKANLPSKINFCWKLSVLFVFIVFVVSLIFGRYLFVEISKELVVSEISSNGQIQIVKKERIEKVLEYFSIRKQKFDQILSSPVPIVDPSL